jgi:hypothetical protein
MMVATTMVVLAMILLATSAVLRRFVNFRVHLRLHMA